MRESDTLIIDCCGALIDDDLLAVPMSEVGECAANVNAERHGVTDRNRSGLMVGLLECRLRSLIDLASVPGENLRSILSIRHLVVIENRSVVHLLVPLSDREVNCLQLFGRVRVWI